MISKPNLLSKSKNFSRDVVNIVDGQMNKLIESINKLDADQSVKDQLLLDFQQKADALKKATSTDAVKFQTRDNKYLFSSDAYAKEYNSENAFAKTYGEHREKLELEPDAIDMIAKECKKNNVYFMSTPFDEPSLDFLVNDLNLNRLKIPSGELTNAPLLLAAGRARVKIILSTGLSILGISAPEKM